VSRPAVGVDLGATNIRAAVVDPDGRIRSASRSKVGDDHRPEVVVERTRGTVADALSLASLGTRDVGGVGVGVAAQVRGDTGTVAVGPNLGWRNVPFGRLLSASLGREARVFNDVEAVTWGECMHGAARSHRDVLVVYAGTGVGGGLVLDGRLHRGATGVAAEIGHVKVRRRGRKCGCGGSGCLEAYLGGANLSRWLRREAGSSWPALLREASGDPSAIHPGMVETLLR
jgi:glucokinase